MLPIWLPLASLARKATTTAVRSKKVDATLLPSDGGVESIVEPLYGSGVRTACVVERRGVATMLPTRLMLDFGTW